MIFVKSSNLPSNQLRADQIASHLEASVYLNDLPEVTDTVVFVKDAKPELVEKAKKQGCKIVFDPIDTFAYPERARILPWHSMVDVAIAYNPAQKNMLLRWFKDVAIIPHQWDISLDGHFCKMDEFCPAYIGHGFNMDSHIRDVAVISDTNEMIEMAPEFNCHVTVREKDSYQAMMKPATKLVTAAAVGAVCLTTKDASAYWLLPDDYPYWIDKPEDFSRVLAQAEREFGGEKWNTAIEMMEKVRDRTGLSEIANLYLKL